jgi:hypothetical protein
MPNVLTTNDRLSCAFQGSVTLSGADKLYALGAPVLTRTLLMAATVSGCISEKSGAPTPCATISTITTGASGKLFVGGVAVMLDSIAAQATPEPHSVGMAPGPAAQQKLRAS